MHISYLFIKNALLPAVISVAEALMPGPAINEISDIAIDQPAVVYAIRNPHESEEVQLAYEFYKKRLSDTSIEMDIETNSVAAFKAMTTSVSPPDHLPTLIAKLG